MNINSHSILLVEDDGDDRYAFHHAFTELGYEEHVKVFDSAEIFFRYLNSLPDSSLYPSLIVLNFHISGMNGSEALMRLKMNEALRDIPVALYSTGMKAMANRLKTMGAAYCFEKSSESEDVFRFAKILKSLAEGEEVTEEITL